jgi:Fe-S cluster assembly protein SufD
MISQNEQNRLTVEGAEDFYRSLLHNAKPWYASFREESRRILESMPLPTVKDEEWKYTNIAPLGKERFRLPTNHDLKDVERLWQYADKRDVNFVIINGCFISELSNFHGVEGVKFMTIKEAVDGDLLTEADLRRTTSNDPQPFTTLNHVYHRCGAYIQIEKKARIDRLLHIIHVDTGADQYAVSPRTVVRMNRSSEATILESHISFTDNRYFINALTDLYLGENSILHYSKAQDDSPNAVHVGSTRVWQRPDSRLDGFSLMRGGQLTRNNVSVISEGEGTDSTINGLYTVTGDQHVDNHTMIDHREPNCTSHQLYKGLLTGSARSVFNGKIYVRQIAQQTNSYQLNKNLLLGKNCRVDTKPQLEIHADDVKCTHGATIGQMNEDEIFYLQTRCISRDEAVRMLARGFVNDIITTVASESVRTKLNRILVKTLDTL